MTRSQIQALINSRVTGSANRIALERQLWTVLMDESCKLFEVKEIDVNLTLHPNFITDNFDGTGLGKNDFEGFAICNGNNGTFDRIGRTGIGYGTGYTDIGTPVGSADAVVVAHSHKTATDVETSGNYSTILKYTASRRNSGVNVEYIFQGTSQVPNVGDTQTVGVSGVGKNIPPSIITLMIQRVA